jgi:methylglutaconyl-CoA hydratase
MTYTFEGGTIESSLSNGIFRIEFHHEQGNSFPSAMLSQLTSEIETAGKNQEARIIILQSKGNQAFCAGASFKELTELQNEDEGFTFFNGFANVINALRLCPKLVIGRIHDKCVGGGVGLAAACDYAIATEKSSIKLSELAIGIGAFVIGPVVERRIGNTHFMQLCIDASNWRNAEWAREKGLFAEVHPDEASLDKAITALSEKLASYSPDAMAALKNIFWGGTEDWNELLKERAAISGKLVLSDFTKEAIARFKSRNK